MEIAKGGDLYSYISDLENPENDKGRLFLEKGESSIKFLIAGVILGLEYLHKN